MIKSAMVVYCVALFLLLMNCNPKVVNQTNTSSSAACPRVESEKADTVSYIVSFTNQYERQEFANSLSDFLKKYHFAKLSSDTIKHYYRIQLLPASTADHTMTITSVAQSEFIEGTIIPETATQSNEEITPSEIDTIIPDVGGTIKMYLPRSDMDYLFSSLVSIDPFGDSTSAVLRIQDSSARKVILKLNGKITNAKNQVISAIDLISSWTEYVKKHPAEGYALFSNVEGIKEFVSGNEATVRGFGALDEKTVFLRLAQPDPHVFDRLRTRRLLQGNFKLGLYHIVKEDNSEITLLPNTLFQMQKPYLDKLILRKGEDSNPILSYSLNKYDVIILYSTSELEYARRQFGKNSSFHKILTERYFLSLASQDNNFRTYMKNMVQKAELLRNFVKADGELINAVVTDSIAPSEQQKGGFIGSMQYRILYRNDDPVSKAIAQKLLADLSQAKVSSTLIAADVTDYERKLILQDYDCAVGWVPQSVLQDKSEQLRMASIWFGGETDEHKLISEAREIPLFEIRSTLVTRNPIELHKNLIEGIFIKKNTIPPQAN
ncbi:MAG: hypothetical protein GX640_19765 [Fibrobacter sp.]|nr:hypothetical protein [Fibrobacter sp.]